MSSKKATFLMVVVGLLISATLTFFLLRASTQREAGKAQAAQGTRVLSPEPETIDRPLPETQLTDMQGKEVPSNELRQGRYLLIFLTSGCGPCVDEANAVSRLIQESTSSLRVYGVGIERSAQVAAFAEEFDLKFPFLLDKGSKLRQAFDIRRFPTKLLVEDGIVKKAWYGKAQDEDKLRSQLALVEVK